MQKFWFGMSGLFFAIAIMCLLVGSFVSSPSASSPPVTVNRAPNPTPQPAPNAVRLASPPPTHDSAMPSSKPGFLEQFDHAPDYSNNWEVSSNLGNPSVIYSPRDLHIHADATCLTQSSGPYFQLRSKQGFSGNIDLSVELNHQGHGRTSVALSSGSRNENVLLTELDTDDTNFLAFTVKGRPSTESQFLGTPFMNRWVSLRIVLSGTVARFYADGKLLHESSGDLIPGDIYYVRIGAGSVCWKSGPNDTSFRQVAVVAEPQ